MSWFHPLWRIHSFLSGRPIRKDPSIIKLGKGTVKDDARTLRYETYSTLPVAPSSLSLQGAVSTWPIFGNDKYGDCVFADIGHQTELWTASANTEAVLTDQDVLSGYSQVTGFNPNDPATDQGTVWLDALNWWRKTGMAGHKIDGYTKVSATNNQAIKNAVWLFGGVQLGIALPNTAQAQTGKLWYCPYKSSPDSQPGSWGGHAVPVVGFSKTRVYVVTWGFVQAMTWCFFNRYVDEAYVTLSQDWISQVTQKSPEGFNYNALTTDLGQFS